MAAMGLQTINRDDKVVDFAQETNTAAYYGRCVDTVGLDEVTRTRQENQIRIRFFEPQNQGFPDCNKANFLYNTNS